MRTSWIALLFVLAAAPAAEAAKAAKTVSYKVVVNAENPIKSMKRVEVSTIFLKKKKTFPNKKKALPVTLKSKSDVAKKFNLEVHRKKSSAFQRYWQKMIFSGRATPPPAKATDAKVMEFIKANPSAIGYVSGSAKLPKGVKVIDIADVPGQQHSKKKPAKSKDEK